MKTDLIAIIVGTCLMLLAHAYIWTPEQDDLGCITDTECESLEWRN